MAGGALLNGKGPAAGCLEASKHVPRLLVEGDHCLVSSRALVDVTVGRHGRLEADNDVSKPDVFFGVENLRVDHGITAREEVFVLAAGLRTCPCITHLVCNCQHIK